MQNNLAPDLALSPNHLVALAMAKRGFRVLPCWELQGPAPTNKVKSPRNAGGHLRASLNVDQINAWWTQWPDALVGIDLPSAGLFVIDADRHGGPDGLAAWGEIAGLWGDVGSKTVPYVQTPSGSLHAYFRRPEGMHPSNRTGGLPLGIDVRGAGYTIAPGCVMPDGRAYTALEGSPPLSLDIPYAPDWLVNLIGCTSGPREDHAVEPLISWDGEVEMALATQALDDNEGAVEGAGGNAATYALACRLRALAISEARCIELMSGDWNDRCSPPWPLAELETVIGNAYRYGQGAPGAGSPRFDFADFANIQPIDGPEFTGAVNRVDGRVLRLIDPADWQGKDVPRREWILEAWIPARQATLLTGHGGAGKSLVMQQACTCIAMGVPFLGIETRQAVTLYLTCEDDEDELHRRQGDICNCLGLDMQDLSGRFHLVSLVGSIGNEFATFDPSSRMTVTDAYRRVVAATEDTGAEFVALDNVAHLFAGNENIRVQVAAFMALLNGLASAGPAIALIGHPNKAGQDYSGSTAWENQVRSRLFFGSPREAGVAVDPNARQLSRGKANYAPLGAPLNCRWQSGAYVVDDGLVRREATKLAALTNAADDDRFMACLDERTKQRRAVSDKPSPAYAPTQFAKMPMANCVGKDRFVKAMERLFASGRIERAELWRGDDRKPVFGLRRTLGSPGD